MARLPVYEPQITSGAQIQARAPGAQSFLNPAAIVADSASRATEGLARDAYQQMRVAREKENVFWAKKTAMETSARWEDEAREEIRSGNFNGIGERFIPKMAGEVEELTAGVEDQNTKLLLMSELQQSQFGVSRYLRDEEYKGKVAEQQSSILSQLDLARNKLLTDGSRLDQSLQDLDILLSSSMLPAAEKEKLRRVGKSQLAQSTIDGMMNTRPGAALEALRGGQLDEILDADSKASLLNRATSRVEQVNREARAEGERRAAISQFDQQQKIVEAIRYMDSGGDPEKLGVSRADIETAFAKRKGGLSVQGERIAAAWEASQDANEIIRELPAAGAEAIRNIVMSNRPDATKQSPEEFAKKEELYKRLAPQLEQRSRQIEADPAGYTLQAFPSLAKTLESAGTPEDFQKAAMELKQTQLYLGVNPAKVSLLTKPQEEQIVAQLSGGNDQQAAQVISSLQQRYGRLAPQVLKQVGPKLPPAVAIAGTLGGNAGAHMLSAVKNEKELSDILPKEDKDEIKITIDDLDEMASFSASFKDTIDGGAGNVARVKDAVRVSAMAYRQKGFDPKDAAKRAADDVLGKYDFIDIRDSTLRIPKSAAIPERALTRGIKNFLKELPADAVAPPVSNLPLPKSTVNTSFARALDAAAGGRGDIGIAAPEDPEARKLSYYMGRVRMGARPVMNAEENGVYFLMENNKPLLGKDGRPIEAKFEDLKRLQ